MHVGGDGLNILGSRINPIPQKIRKYTHHTATKLGTTGKLKNNLKDGVERHTHIANYRRQTDNFMKITRRQKTITREKKVCRLYGKQHNDVQCIRRWIKPKSTFIEAFKGITRVVSRIDLC